MKLFTRLCLLAFITVSWKVYSQQIHPIVGFHVTYYDKLGYESMVEVPHDGSFIDRDDVFSTVIDVPHSGTWYLWLHSIDVNGNDSHRSEEYTVFTDDYVLPPPVNLRIVN